MTYRLGGADGEMAARDFFSGLMMTALPAGACLTSVRFPVWQGENRLGVGFHEVNARRSDFAFVAAAAQVALDGDGKAKRIALGIGAATDTPLRLDAVEKELTGSTLDEKQVTEAVRAALSRCRDAERPACLRRIIAAARRSRSPRAPSPMPRRKAWGTPMRIELTVNGEKHDARGRGAHHAARLLARSSRR